MSGQYAIYRLFRCSV